MTVDANYRSALVTGASGGIGAAVVRSLRKAGYAVHALGRRAELLKQLADETGCVPISGDLRDQDFIYETLGRLEIDVLVNNAGIGRAFVSFFSATREDIDTSIDVNVTSALHVMRAVVPGMIKRGRGHVVTVGSVGGIYTTRFALYGAAKAALHQANLNLRLELQGTGVRNTEIIPGRTRTGFFETALGDADVAQRTMEQFEPLEPEDVAATVLFAVSLPGRANITTLEITPLEQINGGQSFKRISAPS